MTHDARRYSSRLLAFRCDQLGQTPEAFAYLRAHDCDEIQGYYLSKPITADEMGRFLERDLRNFVSPAAA